MHKAATWAAFTLAVLADAVVNSVNWPGTAVRVVSKSRQSIHRRIRQSSARHGSVMTTRRTASPAMTRMATANPPSRPARSSPERGYEMSLIFRNNAISDEYPEGISMHTPNTGRSSRSRSD